MEISSFSTYISRASMQQTSTHHTQPLQLQRDALGRAECSEERVQGPDNTPTSIPKTQGLQEPTCKLYCGQKKTDQGVEGEDPNPDIDKVWDC